MGKQMLGCQIRRRYGKGLGHGPIAPPFPAMASGAVLPEEFGTAHDRRRGKAGWRSIEARRISGHEQEAEMGRCQPDENGRNGEANPTESSNPYRDTEKYRSRRHLEDAPDDNVAQERLRQHHQAKSPG